MRKIQTNIIVSRLLVLVTLRSQQLNTSCIANGRKFETVWFVLIATTRRVIQLSFCEMTNLNGILLRHIFNITTIFFNLDLQYYSIWYIINSYDELTKHDDVFNIIQVSIGWFYLIFLYIVIYLNMLSLK